MKSIFILTLLFSSVTFASMSKQALVKDHVVENIAEWNGDQSWKTAMQNQGYAIVDVTSISYIGPGFTCVKCDGTDFVPPVDQ